MNILSRTLALPIAICAFQACWAGGQLRLTNDTDTALAFTLISKDQKVDRWLGPREITDIYVGIDDDERILITRTGGNTSKDLLASPTKVLDLKAFRTDLAESGTIFAYVGGDPEDGFKFGFICLGPGKFIPFTKDAKCKAEFNDTIESVKATLKRCKGIWPTDTKLY